MAVKLIEQPNVLTITSRLSSSGYGGASRAYALEFAVGSSSDSQFLHRANRDGSFDSICKECFRTVATVKCESDLNVAERDHVCDPWTRSRRRRVREIDELAGSLDVDLKES